MNYDSIRQPYWDDAPTYIVGGGPSLRGFDFDRLRGRGHIIAVNQSMFDSPCECGVTVDHIFIGVRTEELREFARHKELYIAAGDPERLPFIECASYLKIVSEPGLSMNVEYLHKGATSGYAALGIAVLKRSRMIYLLGFDYSVDGSNHHYHNRYPWHHKASDQSWAVWARRYEPAAKDCLNLGVRVFNASPNSALPYFPKVTLEEALNASVSVQTIAKDQLQTSSS
jgi:hypothetical protein